MDNKTLVINGIKPSQTQSGVNQDLWNIDFYIDFANLGENLRGTIAITTADQLAAAGKAVAGDPWKGYRDYITGKLNNNLSDILSVQKDVKPTETKPEDKGVTDGK